MKPSWWYSELGVTCHLVGFVGPICFGQAAFRYLLPGRSHPSQLPTAYPGAQQKPPYPGHRNRCLGGALALRDMLRIPL